MNREEYGTTKLTIQDGTYGWPTVGGEREGKREQGQRWRQ
jgi:hypothetical protein